MKRACRSGWNIRIIQKVVFENDGQVPCPSLGWPSGRLPVDCHKSMTDVDDGGELEIDPN